MHILSPSSIAQLLPVVSYSTPVCFHLFCPENGTISLTMSCCRAPCVLCFESAVGQGSVGVTQCGRGGQIGRVNFHLARPGRVLEFCFWHVRSADWLKGA
ncbi:hypothetical protein BC628DRAFT_1079093 [Trametes gibbosa]|nr:hypothetical protein BC628DRAFT_1079093 [Trametes gibbosa]